MSRMFSDSTTRFAQGLAKADLALGGLFIALLEEAASEDAFSEDGEMTSGDFRQAIVTLQQGLAQA